MVQLSAKRPAEGQGGPVRDIVAVGWDQSILHAGIVAMNAAGNVCGQWCLTDKAGEAEAFGPGATRLPARYKPKRGRDQHELEVRRLVWLQRWLRVTVCELLGRTKNDAGALPFGYRLTVAVEDYAYGAAHGAHQMGEAQGVLRCELMQSPSIQLRLCDVASVKLFATGMGNATKDMIRAAAPKYLGDVHPSQAATARQWAYGDECKTVREDMADALVLARMAWTELQVRAGLLPLAELSEGERRVFLRTTPTYPVNLLDRPFATAEDFEPESLRSQPSTVGRLRG